MAGRLTTFGQSSKIKKETFGSGQMVFGAMTEVPLRKYRRGMHMLSSKIKMETSGLLVE